MPEVYNNLVYMDDTFEICWDIVDEKVTEIALHKNCKTIDSHTFSDLENLEKVVLNKNLQYISYGTFKNCKKLKDINLEDTKVETIGVDAFINCASLEKVSFPSTLKELEIRCFAGCNLKEVDLSNTKISTISLKLFENNKNLYKVLLPDSSHTVDHAAFSGCTNLQDIDLKNVKNFHFSSIVNTKIRELTLPPFIEEITIDSGHLPELDTIFFTNPPIQDGMNSIADFPAFLKRYYKNTLILTNDLDSYLKLNKSFKEINNLYKKTNKER